VCGAQVPRVASIPEIKAAYKLRCLDYHPDKHTNKPKEEQKKAEDTFKLLGDALEIFDDPMKKQLYDEGHDKQAIDERVKRANEAAREHNHSHR
jgi:DnaJ family protein C protein 7